MFFAVYIIFFNILFCSQSLKKLPIYKYKNQEKISGFNYPRM